MSPLRYVLCVLLVVTVTTATRSKTTLAELENAQKLMNMTIATATKSVTDISNAAGDHVAAALSQMVLTAPLEMTYSFDGTTYSQVSSVECYEFLKKRIETNEKEVIKCLESPQSVMMGYMNQAVKNVDSTLRHFNERRRFASYCELWYQDNLTEALMCRRAVLKDITEVTYRARERMFKLIDAVIEAGKSWIAETGACVARHEGGSAMEDWTKACGK